MRHLLSPTLTTTMPTISPQLHQKPKRPFANPNSSPPPFLCKHSPSATLDILILILVLFSGAFLLASYLSYLFRSLSLLFPPLSHSPLPYAASFLTFLAAVVFITGGRKRTCGKLGCNGLKNAMEFDLQLQTEECLKTEGGLKEVIDGLPWKGGSNSNPDYECLRSELRKMAPPNGRAVLLFRAKCGCPMAKLEGWGPKRGRRHRKSLTNLTLNGEDYR